MKKLRLRSSISDVVVEFFDVAGDRFSKDSFSGRLSIPRQPVRPSYEGAARDARAVRPKPRTKGVPVMIKGLAGATIWSEDLNRLLPFYRDVVGLKIRIQTPGFVVFGEPDAPALGLGTHSEVHGRNADPARHMVGLLTDDVDADSKRLKAAGVEFVEEPTDYGHLRMSTLRDPEGNLIQMLQLKNGESPAARPQREPSRSDY
jgi:lactoylglutathione lyase